MAGDRGRGAGWAVLAVALGATGAPAQDGGARAPNKVLVLDGASAVRFDLVEALRGASELTVEVWARGGASSDWSAIVANSDAGGVYIAWTGKDRPHPLASAKRDRWHELSPASSPTWDRWHHFALTCDARTHALFVDGEPVASWEGDAPLVPSGLPLLVGADPDGRGPLTNWFRGAVDELRVSDTVRYRREFRPVRRHHPDAHTLLLAHFDDLDVAAHPDTSRHGRAGRSVGNPVLEVEDVDPDGRGAVRPLGTKDAALLGRVDLAVTRGVRWLCERQQEDGHWSLAKDEWPEGTTALVLHTLLKGGLSRHDERIARGFAYLRRAWADARYQDEAIRRAEWKTYTLGSILLALESLADWHPRTSEPPKGPPGERLEPGDRQWVAALRDHLLAIPISRDKEGRPAGWGYPKWPRDNSNTQFAVLGLRAAARLGHGSPSTAWAGILASILGQQEADGPLVRRVMVSESAERRGEFSTFRSSTAADRARGWTYRVRREVSPKHKPWFTVRGSMTCVGLACLVIAGEQLNLAARAGDAAAVAAIRQHGADYGRAIHDGLAWLQAHFTVHGNPNFVVDQHHYYLYGLERAGVLLDVPNIGEHDWYREGAEVLLLQQASQGQWAGAPSDTCFAILFLTRATRPALSALTLAGRRQ